ncbi:nitrogen fixation protein FixC [Vulcanibacillus modesticaldus]|uniref:Nitrogen fixation protein FixC n=1 Tax=Vulcanibacillus modesticaldus TaxID=337097 RepID=A0A1D2YU96_9BACI|nr:FAD-dependent oxidoreductase [Vulcanibacillus modesticaldus]OEF99274.1 nitrogen fixation protein FixC [Vulcanibacillus modesticaldus]
MAEKFDVIIVGAGPAGSAAANVLAKAGLKVIMIERGEYPGAKNVMGGVLYRHQLQEIIPDFLDEAPLQRPIVEQRFWMLDENSAFQFGHKDLSWAKPPHNNFTVFRAQFDQWFAKKAVEQGALLVNETVVTEAIVEDGRVIGVRTDRPDGDIYADIVILADGVNSLLAKQLGFHKELKTSEVALATMQVINLPAEKIEDRFNLEPNQGATIEVFGDSTKGMVGTGFIYTNKDSISIGTGTLLSDLVKNNVRPHELLETFKQHPMVRKLIEGGEPKEYLAHLIPEGGYHSIPKLVGHGVMVVGDAAQLVNGIHREGSNLAMASGKLAAETAIMAKEVNDFSENVLDTYRIKLMESFVGQDLKKYKDATHMMAKQPQYFNEYLPLLNRAASEMFTVDGTSKWDKQKKIIGMVQERGMFKTAIDLYRMWKVMK